jgi:uncharacterized protein YdaU (DUF1376 family)
MDELKERSRANRLCRLRMGRSRVSKQSSAWFPFYVGDYLGDTQRLTTEQHGAYLLLILDYWRAGPPPDDDEVLRQITKLDAKAWRRQRPALARMFQVTDGEWHHKRIDKELASAEENAERRSSKAQKAAQARWGDASSNARSMPEAMLGECPPQSPPPKEEVSDPSGSGGEPPADPDKIMFDSGLRLLAQAGTPDAKARPILGKWKRDYGSEAVIVALSRAQREGAIEPISFITAALENSRGRSGKQSGWLDA